MINDATEETDTEEDHWDDEKKLSVDRIDTEHFFLSQAKIDVTLRHRQSHFAIMDKILGKVRVDLVISTNCTCLID